MLDLQEYIKDKKKTTKRKIYKILQEWLTNKKSESTEKNYRVLSCLRLPLVSNKDCPDSSSASYTGYCVAISNMILVRSCVPKPFSVHKLVQVACQLVLMAALHLLEFDFNSIPVRFHILGVDLSGSIYKLNSIVDYSVATHILETSNPVVSYPLV